MKKLGRPFDNKTDILKKTKAIKLPEALHPFLKRLVKRIDNGEFDTEEIENLMSGLNKTPDEGIFKDIRQLEPHYILLEKPYGESKIENFNTFLYYFGDNLCWIKGKGKFSLNDKHLKEGGTLSDFILDSDLIDLWVLPQGSPNYSKHLALFFKSSSFRSYFEDLANG